MSAADARTAILRPDLAWAIRRFPFALLASALLTFWLLVFELKRAVAREYVTLHQDQVMFMLILAFLMATAVAFATLRLRPWIGLTAQIVGFFLGLETGYISGTTPYTVMPLFLSMICFISLGAGYAAGRGMVDAWLTALGLAANFALCLVALAIILIGSFLILSSIDALLGFGTDDSFDLLLIVASFLGVPLLWLSLSRFCEDEPGGDQPVNLLHRVVSVVTDGLLIPLMLIFAGVIHLYAGRIALMLELPKGQIGWIVPTYLCIGYGVYLLAHTPGTLLPRLRSVFLHAWVLASLVPLVLLGMAAAMRIEVYGVTEERYLLALIVLSFALIAASALVRRRLDLRVLPLIGGTLALVAAIGPLSARNVTIYSQSERVRAIISSVPPERWAQSPDGGLSEQQKKDLVSAVRELEGRDIQIKQIIPSDAWPKHLPQNSPDLAEDLKTGVATETTEHVHMSFGGYDVLRLGSVTFINEVYIDWSNSTPMTRQSDTVTYLIQVKGNILEVSGEDKIARFDLSTLLAIKDDPETGSTKLVLGNFEGRKGELFIKDFTRRHGPEGAELVAVSAQIALY